MKNKKILLTGIIISILFIIGCQKDVETGDPVIPTPDPIPEPSAGADLDDLSGDIDSLNSLDEELGDPDLENLESDLDNIDW